MKCRLGECSRKARQREPAPRTRLASAIKQPPRVFGALRERHLTQGCPTEGWIFPSASRENHFNGDSSKDEHAKALAVSGVQRFEPYVLRHTALTGIAAACNDPFVVMRIAGHSSITMTQRYCHPQADAVERAFAKLGAGGGVRTRTGLLKSSNKVCCSLDAQAVPACIR